MTVQEQDQIAEEFLSGKLSHVDVARIEAELRSLWKQAAHGDPDSGSGTVVRACALNLILLSSDEDAESGCSDVLDEIEQGHPCRSILAIYRPDKPHRLEAWVSARCHLMGESKQICSEQITVCCEGGKPQELASVVRPLIVPDLPVFLWWRQSTLNWNEFAALHACSRRFIVDSARYAFEHQILLDTARLIASNQQCLYVSDLSWRRMHSWCRATADSFDGFPMPSASLKQVKQITVKYSGDGKKGMSNQCLLYVGWLSSRLNWEPKSWAPDRVQFTVGGGTGIDVLFTADGAADGDGSLQHIEMQFAGDSRKLLIELEATEEAVFVVARNSDSDEKEATRIAQVAGEAVLIGQELEVLTQDPIYEESANMAALILTLRD